MSKTILKIEDLHISFNVHAGKVQAIRGVDIKIKESEIVCLVGESGSGKSVTAKSIMGLLPEHSTKIESGKILLEGVNLAKFQQSDFTFIRGHQAAMIFQDPMTALNPLMTIGEQIKEALLLHHIPELGEYDVDHQKLYEEVMAKKLEINNNFRDAKIAIENLEGKAYISKSKKIEKEYVKNLKSLQKETKILIKNAGKDYYYKKVIEILTLVGIKNPESMYKQYPHQLSGGMRQRIVISIALSCEPKLLIADEPTTALDVTIQAQILELVKELQKKFKFAVLFITHDLGVVANMADHVYVMYAGKVVEKGLVNEVFYNPRHPYTWGLLNSMPNLENDASERLPSIPGTPPNLLDPPIGDAFAPRNQYALEIDFVEQPPMFQVSKTHYAPTWLLDERAPKIDIPSTITNRINQYKNLEETYE